MGGGMFARQVASLGSRHFAKCISRNSLVSRSVKGRQITSSRLFAGQCILLGTALATPTAIIHVPQPQAQSREFVPNERQPTQNLGFFSRLFNNIRMILRTIGFSIVGSVVITSGLIVYCIPFMPECTRSIWRSFLVIVLGNCGACSTKLGQWAATRPDLFPENICKSLTDLHTKAPTHAFRHTKRILESFYNADIHSVFCDFDCEPLASGAIAQVYKASLIDKETNQKRDVVIKVRHPHVVDNIAVDLNIFRTAGTMLEFIPGLKCMSVRQNIESFAAQMEAQLSMINEGYNLTQFRKNFAQFHNICFPEPFIEYSNDEILVESFEEGIQVSEYFKEKNQNLFVNCAPSFKEELSALGFNAFLKMMFIDNFVHGDLHPGNVLVREHTGINGKPQIIFLDAGLVIKLSERDRTNFLDLFAAVAAGNGKKGAQLMIERSGATIPTKELQDKFKGEMEVLFESVTSRPLGEIPIGRAFFKVMRLCRECQVHIDGNFCSLITGLIVVEGLARALNANFNLIEAARPLLAKDRQFVMAYIRNRL